MVAGGKTTCFLVVMKYTKRIKFKYYCCKREEWDGDEEEPDFAVHSRLPAAYYNHSAGNGLNFSSIAYPQDHSHPGALCSHCKPHFHCHQIAEIGNGGESVSYNTVSEEELEMLTIPKDLPMSRAKLTRDAFSRSRSISTDV
ncbi:protein FAM163B-like isoform X2 [Carcharodon carcharias]|uniref:protein FAM163B-like isoform X2 n=1 Tax=Carcharodon carcharias TaxID=13397 RepID=UPI001B7F11A6|nr:protein FAM163B-like isoform X2 [Carcharodon carcharias]